MSILSIHSCHRGGLLLRFRIAGGIVTHSTGVIIRMGYILRGMILSIMTTGIGGIPITATPITTTITTGLIVRPCTVIRPMRFICVVAGRLRAGSIHALLHRLEAVPRCLQAV